MAIHGLRCGWRAGLASPVATFRRPVGAKKGTRTGHGFLESMLHCSSLYLDFASLTSCPNGAAGCSHGCNPWKGIVFGFSHDSGGGVVASRSRELMYVPRVCLADQFLRHCRGLKRDRNYPRVTLRPAGRPCFTRGYIPSPRWGEELQGLSPRVGVSFEDGNVYDQYNCGGQQMEQNKDAGHGRDKVELESFSVGQTHHYDCQNDPLASIYHEANRCQQMGV